MSGAEPPDLPPWLQRCEKDVRDMHKTLRQLLRGSEEIWEKPGPDGRTRAERMLHMISTFERVLEALRYARAEGARPQLQPDFGQKARRQLLFRTWRWPPDWGFGSTPAGEIPTRRALEERLLRWAADTIEFLRAPGAAVLREVRSPHHALGPLNAPDWLRLLRIWVRHHELHW